MADPRQPFPPRITNFFFDRDEFDYEEVVTAMRDPEDLKAYGLTVARFIKIDHDMRSANAKVVKRSWSAPAQSWSPVLARTRPATPGERAKLEP